MEIHPWKSLLKLVRKNKKRLAKSCLMMEAKKSGKDEETIMSMMEERLNKNERSR